MGRLEGKVAIVTGAGRIGNIGLAICEAFLREGAKAVIGSDMRTDEAEAIAARIRAIGGSERFRLVQQDVTRADHWERVVAQAVGEFDGLDILVNNAGIAIHGGIAATSLEDLRKVMAVNHDALFLGMKHCAPALAEAVNRFPGGGAIVNNCSMASYKPNAQNVGYHVSKAAARMLTLCGAAEFGPQKIRVNSVHPGLTMTPLIYEALEQYTASGMFTSVEAAIADISGRNPLKTAGQSEDAAHAFVYLASEEARFVTGAAICHDGGLGERY
jgi:3alpha(or 20beta)-hydroxysteroid dehydrogenase/cyclopentanol dehydrogenase